MPDTQTKDAAANAPEPDESEEQVAESVLVLSFMAPGSAEFVMRRQNVTPMQMLAAASYLEYRAKRMIEQAELNRSVIAKPQIIVPGLQPVLH